MGQAARSAGLQEHVQASSSSSNGNRSRCCVIHWGLASGVTFQELSGSLGDLGTFLPLVVALAATIGLDLGTTLLFTGLYNIASGLGFRIPMCVQPMKTIAAVALAAPGLTLPEALSAGLFVSGSMLLLGLSGLMDAFNAAVPGSIVRGIQLAVGLALAKKGISQALQLAPHSWRPWLGAEGLLLGLAAILFLLVTTVPAAAAAAAAAGSGQAPDQNLLQQQQQRLSSSRMQQGANCDADLADVEQQQEQQQLLPGEDQQCIADQQQQPAAEQEQHRQQRDQRELPDNGCCSSSAAPGIPSALVLVLVGLVLIPITHPSVLSGLSLGPSIPNLFIPTWQQLKSGVLKAGLAQLPLTSLNSCIAVTQLAQQLFPQRLERDGWRWRPGPVAVSAGLMNLVGCWWGAFPCCHGSGGLAAQYKFGARSGAAPVLLGIIKAALALLFGSSLLALLQQFPGPLLGSMLLFSGLELAAAAGKEREPRGVGFMLLTAAAIMGLGDTALGFLVGLGGYAAVAGYERACCHVSLMRARNSDCPAR